MTDRLEYLTTLRDTLSGLLESADERTAPAVSRELRAVLGEIEALPVAGKPVTTDELKKRRATRQAEAKDRARTASGD